MMKLVLFVLGTLPSAVMGSGFPSTQQILLGLTAFFALWIIVYWGTLVCLRRWKPALHWAIRHLIALLAYPALLIIIEALA